MFICMQKELFMMLAEGTDVGAENFELRLLLLWLCLDNCICCIRCLCKANATAAAESLKPFLASGLPLHQYSTALPLPSFLLLFFLQLTLLPPPPPLLQLLLLLLLLLFALF